MYGLCDSILFTFVTHVGTNTSAENMQVPAFPVAKAASAQILDVRIGFDQNYGEKQTGSEEKSFNTNLTDWLGRQHREAPSSLRIHPIP